jgi:hypothetical protein
VLNGPSGVGETTAGRISRAAQQRHVRHGDDHRHFVVARVERHVQRLRDGHASSWSR